MLVQYYLVDRTLKMRQGKACAQCAHGALIVQKRHCKFSSNVDKERIHRHLSENGFDSTSSLDAVALELQSSFVETYKAWDEGGNAKVVLKADAELLQRAMDEFEFAVEVIDAGFTEVAPGSRTVVVLPVMKKEDAPDWIQALKLL